MKKKLIQVQHDSTCLANKCFIPRGTQAWWVKGIGVWCRDCKEPQSVAKELQKLEEARRLGFEPYEFGQAPMLRDE